MGLDTSLNLSILRIYFPPCSCMVFAGDHSVMNVIYQLSRITWAPRINRMWKLVVSRDDAKHMCQEEEEEERLSVATLAAETCGRFQTDNFCVPWICDGRPFSFPLSVLCSLRVVLTEVCLCEEWKLPPQWHYTNSFYTSKCIPRGQLYTIMWVVSKANAPSKVAASVGWPGLAS